MRYYNYVIREKHTHREREKIMIERVVTDLNIDLFVIVDDECDCEYSDTYELIYKCNFCKEI